MNMNLDQALTANTGVRSEAQTATWIGATMMAVAALVGVFVRYKGIGQWPLAYDEFLIAQSVKHVLETGLPGFETGGYYTRGLLYQYMAAGFIKLFGHFEFWLRMIPATFNMMALPALYWLAKKIGGSAVAFAAVILFMLSIWEIEFARFARMYAIFQAIFLWYLVALYKVVIEDKQHCRKWMYLLSAIAPLVYEGAVFLAVLNFLPIAYRRRIEIFSSRLWIPLIIFVCTYLFLSTDFRRMGIDNYLPESFASASVDGEGKFLFPTLLPTILFSKPVWAAFFFLLTAVNIWFGHKILLLNTDAFDKTLLVLIVLSGLLNQFGLMMGMVVFAIAIHPRAARERWRRYMVKLAIPIAASFIFWIVFGIAGDLWHQMYPAFDHPAFTKYLLLLFNYPDVYAQVVYQWLLVLPRVLVFLGVSSAAAFLLQAFQSSEKSKGFMLLVAVLVATIMMVGIVKPPYHSTRYTFFLYPVGMLAGCASISVLTRRIVNKRSWHGTVFAVVIAAYLGLAEDYKIQHLLRIDSPEYNFRLNLSRTEAAHYYMRFDYRTPAEIINAAAHPEDIIISILTPVAHYLDRLDFIYIDDPGHLKNQSASNGTKELWTNTDLIHEKHRLWELIHQSTAPVWIISGSDSNRRNRSIEAISQQIKERYAPFVVGGSIDRKILVYRVPPSN